MRISAKGWLLGTVLSVAVAGVAAVAPAQDKAAPDKQAVVKERQATMKQQGKNLGAVKAYLDGKGDQAAAEAAAADLTKTTRKIPDLFPPGTAGPDPTGDYAAKPEIWSEWDKFLVAQKTAAGKADALLVAVKSGAKGDIQTAFADLGKNGCGGCHTDFREKLKH